MNMLNRNCKMSFVKPEFLKKAQSEIPRLYDIGCYNDNLALMLAPESNETIHLAQESRSKLSDLIKPFDYKNLNNLYELFVHQRNKLVKQTYFSNDSKMNDTSVKNVQFKKVFKNQSILLEKRMNETILWSQKCKSSVKFEFIKQDVQSLFQGIEYCNKIIKGTLWNIPISPEMKNVIEQKMSSTVDDLATDVDEFYQFLKEEMVEDLKYFNALEKELVEIILFILDSGCSKHMTGNLKLLVNFVEKFLGNDLLTGSRGTDLYSITLQERTSPNPICLMAKASSSQAWLWHRRLSHLNFDTINLLSKNDIANGLPKLKFIKDHLYLSCELGKAKLRVESINGKKYVLVIINDYSRYTWTHFLRSKYKKPEVLGNRYSLKDKNEAKTDKTEHGNGMSVKNQSRRHVHLK
ncbi:retrovirus-related pol polyprotein from transposon TNT 1-94 [Tanacetum coccineum]